MPTKEELLEKLKQTAWVNFEAEVFAEVQRLIDSYRLMLIPQVTKVYRKRGYFSKDRNKEIIFDIAVEAFADGGATPSLVWLWECKDYPNRRVKVDEVEEFAAKMDQIGAVKGTMVTRVGFEAGAIEYANSKRIGLATLKKVLECYTQFSQAGRSIERIVIRSEEGITTDGAAFSPEAFLQLGQMIQTELRYVGLLSKDKISL